jgi:hypothetical protein
MLNHRSGEGLPDRYFLALSSKNPANTEVDVLLTLSTRRIVPNVGDVARNITAAVGHYSPRDRNAKNLVHQ